MDGRAFCCTSQMQRPEGALGKGRFEGEAEGRVRARDVRGRCVGWGWTTYVEFRNWFRFLENLS
jgi:hypothetical protein